MKLLWGCRMVYQGETNGCFGHQQYGSRPRHQAIDAVHRKTMTYDLSRILRTNLGLLDNDASGCFDRIVVSLGMIASRRLRMKKKACRMHARALAGMKYFIKTAHGISEAFYKAVRDLILFGTGQGSGASPAVWLALVVCLLSALSAIAPWSMIFADPWEDLFDERNADSYVDDTTVGVNDAMEDEPRSIPEIVAALQDVSQKWEQLLYSSGGALELQKCFWYLVHWEWVGGRPYMKPSISSHATLALTSGHVPTYTVIPRKEPWEAMRTLGVRPAPDGNYKKEARYLKDKADTFASRLAISILTPMDTFIFHRSTYTPSMTYSLPVTTISRSQLNKIQSRSISAILNKLGVNRHFPRKVAFGPKELCGMSLLDLSVEQGVRQLQHFRDHIYA